MDSEGTHGSCGPHGNGHRTAVDALSRSAARARDPQLATHPGMARSVVDNVPVSATGAPAELGRVVDEVGRGNDVDTRAGVSGATLSLMDREVRAGTQSATLVRRLLERPWIAVAPSAAPDGGGDA